ELGTKGFPFWHPGIIVAKEVVQLPVPQQLGNVVRKYEGQPIIQNRTASKVMFSSLQLLVDQPNVDHPKRPLNRLPLTPNLPQTSPHHRAAWGFWLVRRSF